MPENAPRFGKRGGSALWNRIRQYRWGEPTAFFLVFVLGLLFFLVQLWTWAIPQLTLYQEFIRTKGQVIGTRIVTKSAPPPAAEPVAYRPEVLLEYRVQGVYYRVWSFDLQTLKPDDGFYENKTRAEEAISKFAIGREVDCRYRESDPSQVIVFWNHSIFGWFLLLLSFSFIVLGIVGFFQSFRLAAISEERKAAASLNLKESPLQSLIGQPRQSDWSTVPDSRLINESPGTHLAYRLALGNRPIFPLVGYILLTIAVNLVAWGVMFHSFLHPETTWPDWTIGILFRGLFCGVGVLLLIGLFQQLLVAFSMGPTLLEISDHPVYPGRRYRILLQQAGVLRFYTLSVDVVCEEIARFRQGTDTTTSRKVVFRQTLFGRNDFETTPDQPLKQEFFMQLPLGAMHSLRLENNEVVWKLEILARVAGWPDLHRECPIVVRPVVLNEQTLEGHGL